MVVESLDREDDPQFVLFSAMKNEAPFILEWLAYHRAIGFTRIIIFSNDSDDGTTEILDALHDAGHIEHHFQNVPKGVSAQINAARLANEMQIIDHGDWITWIDADEFLNIKIGNRRVEDLAAHIGDRHGMLVNWRLFGDSGNQRFGGRFISERFTRSSRIHAPANREAKAFYRHSPVFEGFAQVAINRPLVAAESNLTRESILSGKGVPVTDSPRMRRWLAGEDFAMLARVDGADVGNQVAQLNHYCVRTPDLFRLKRSRGRGWAANEAGESNTRHTDNFYRRMNKNQQVDMSILINSSVVAAGMSALLANDAIRCAHEHGLRRTASAIARAENENAPPFPKLDKIKRFKITLPQAEEHAVRAHYASGKNILEYGSGGSSFIALENKSASLTSVESDPNWAESIHQTLGHFFPDAHYRIHFANTGPVGAWSRPVDDSGMQLYPSYAASVWDRLDFVHPDVILVDGRFRVACFWNAVLRITKPVTLLFDDYKDRPEYHWIEAFAAPIAMHGRLAQFELKPNMAYHQYLTKIVESYIDPR